MKRSTIAQSLTIAAVTALALGITPTAKADDKGCSNASLEGTTHPPDSLRRRLPWRGRSSRSVHNFSTG
jgi:hypothetical protein